MEAVSLIEPFIRKDYLKEIFSLNDNELKDLLATFDIKVDKQLTKKTLTGMLSFLKRTKNIKNINLDSLKYNKKELDKDINLEQIINNRNKNSIIAKKKISLSEKLNDKEIIGVIGKQDPLISIASTKDKNKILKSSFVNTRYELYIQDCKKNNIKPISLLQYKEYKEYPIDSSYIFDTSLNNTILISNGLRKIIGKPKNASKIFNSGYIVYYTVKNKGIDILCQLDITKPFNTNLSSISFSKYNYGLDFYTKCEKFDISLIEKVITNSGRDWTKEEDEKILSFYNSDDYADSNKKKKNKSITLKELAKEFKVYPGTIRSRAVQLGFTNFKKPKEPNWSNEELELLKKCIGKYNPKKISKIFKENGFTRGFVAIGIKLKRLGFSLKLDGTEEINLRMLSSVMGVDSHFFYEQNRLEKLKARKENNQIIFKRENIVIYLKENPYDFPIAKVDPKWLVDLLTSDFQGV
ncbi:hypothetical protein [Aliarcobacter butzleri]|uniref:hypothetical protein n=1 Tax=Aliarcobacter butzleri TaxID=28197 RepID=UPI002B24BC23|nr:hypothetical protein [Aliarcobacter butzleri]